MTVAYADFIVAFPEFGSATTYPETQIDFWIGQAPLQLNAYRFGQAIDLATMLFVAHNVVLSARAAQAAATGAIVGEATGPVSSKAVGSVSVGFDPGLVAIAGAGPWNSTTYGQRLYKLMQAFCAGPVYVSSKRPVINGPIFIANGGRF